LAGEDVQRTHLRIDSASPAGPKSRCLPFPTALRRAPEGSPRISGQRWLRRAWRILSKRTRVGGGGGGVRPKKMRMRLAYHRC
jgi:hypothetical protein